MNSDKLQMALQELQLKRESELSRNFRRSLPFSEGLFDRWERAKRLGFGSGTSIYDASCIFGDVSIGENTWVGPWTILDGSGGGLKIGDFCSISSGVHIYTHDTMAWALSAGACPRKTGSVLIGDRVYIGSQSVITRGVCIGSMSVIGANSFVNTDVPDRMIFAGSPARKIGQVEGDGEDIYLNYA